MSAAVKCPFCKQEIDRSAKVCPHCQSKLSGGCLKTVILIILALILIVSIFTTISENASSPSGHSPSGSTTVSKPSQGTSKSLAQVADVPENHWIFAKNTDSFDGKQTKRCILDSDTLIEDIWKNVRPKLQIRQINNKSTDIILIIDGMLIGHPEDTKRVRLKFDDEQPFSVSYAGAADSSMDKIFLNSTSKIISKLKTAQTLVVEVPIFSEGSRRITFNVSGFSEKCRF